MDKISIIIPIYNEEQSVKKIVDEISNLKLNLDFELVLVNDGSTDKSGEIIQNIKHENIVHVNHLVNKGYGASIKRGIRIAKYENILIIDADGTYPVGAIKELVYCYFDNKLDMVIGSRTGDDVTYPFIKKIPKYFLIKLANYIAGVKIPDLNSGLRIFNKSIALKFLHFYPQGFSFTTTITMNMLCRGYEIEFIPINYYKRIGKSKIRPISDTINFLSLLFKISIYFNPFKFFTPIIIIFALISIFVLVHDIVRNNLAQSSVLFPISTLFFFSIGLLADLIVKRNQN